jgi:hypothetical protein
MNNSQKYNLERFENLRKPPAVSYYETMQQMQPTRKIISNNGKVQARQMISYLSEI